MRSLKPFLLPCISLLLAGACSTMRVSVQVDESADFKAYRTFALVPPKHQAPGRRPLFTREVLDEIKAVLVQKGLAEASGPESADLKIHFYAMVNNRRDFVPPSYRVGRWGRVWRTRPGHVVNYREGTLVIDMVDRVKGELVWEGEGRGLLGRADPGENLAVAVREVLAPFPPGK